jgi:hypothetical protein
VRIMTVFVSVSESSDPERPSKVSVKSASVEKSYLLKLELQFAPQCGSACFETRMT